MECELEASGVTTPELVELLQEHCGLADENCRIQPREPKRRMRMDVSAMVTAVLTSGAASALITGLLKIREAKSPDAGRIVIKTSSDGSIDVPHDCSPQRVKELSQILEGLESPRVQLSL